MGPARAGTIRGTTREVPVLDYKHSDPLDEARRTAHLLEALVRETERIGARQADPDVREALLLQARQSREDAERLRRRLGA